jgi:TPR repeat protein
LIKSGDFLLKKGQGMKKNTNKFWMYGTLATAFFALVWMGVEGKFSSETNSVATENHQKNQEQSGSESTATNGKKTGAATTFGMQASPFELGQPGADALSDAHGKSGSQMKSIVTLPEQESISPEEVARRKKLEKLGYMLPPEYYSKDLKTLRKMAKAGDAYAMMHMGEKYYFEIQGQINHPEYEQGMDYKKSAKEIFQDALIAGNIRSAGIIAELFYQEGNVVEASAWFIVAAQLGDDISAEWFSRTQMSRQATQDIRNAASSRAISIMAFLRSKMKT